MKFQCSQTSKNLVRRLLKKSNKERLTAQDALKDIWFINMKASNIRVEEEDTEDEFSRSMSLGKCWLDEENTQVKFNLSHSPATKMDKKVSVIQCTRSFKEIFEPENSIFGIEDSNEKEFQ